MTALVSVDLSAVATVMDTLAVHGIRRADLECVAADVVTRLTPLVAAEQDATICRLRVELAGLRRLQLHAELGDAGALPRVASRGGRAAPAAGDGDRRAAVALTRLLYTVEQASPAAAAARAVAMAETIRTPQVVGVDPSNVSSSTLAASVPAQFAAAGDMADHLVRGVSMAKRTCSVDGCDGAHEARGLCGKHYQRLRKYGGPAVPRVLGLDLSLTGTGVADGGAATRTVFAGDRRDEARLDWIVTEVFDRYLDRLWLPDLVVMEGLSYGSTGGKAAERAGLHWLIRVGLHTLGVPCAVVPPATLKVFATGKGSADKTAMAISALKRAGVEFGDDNQCDAWWLRAMGLAHLGAPVVDLPMAHLRALGKVAWPEVAS
ncbi:MAG: hypothetical protein ACRDTJ_11435 [Pseudonocardiaceae bacterium]